MDTVFGNLLAGLRRAPLWWNLALADIQQTYKRTLIGMSWIILSFAMFIGAKLVIFGAIASVEPALYAVWLTVGFWVWTLCIGNVSSGSTVFISSKPWILGTNLPYSVYIFQSMVRELIKFGIAGVVVIVFTAWVKWPIRIEWLWAIPGFFVILLNGLWVHMCVGILAARFRDIVHLIDSLLRVLFFLTPILYLPEQLGDMAYLLDYNPFTHFIAIMRDPIAYGTVPMFSWYIVGAITVIGWIAAIIVMRKFGRRIPFWV